MKVGGALINTNIPDFLGINVMKIVKNGLKWYPIYPLPKSTNLSQLTN